MNCLCGHFFFSLVNLTVLRCVELFCTIADWWTVCLALGLNFTFLSLAYPTRPDIIDSAILRPGRLDQLIYIPLPDEPVGSLVPHPVPNLSSPPGSSCEVLYRCQRWFSKWPGHIRPLPVSQNSIDCSCSSFYVVVKSSSVRAKTGNPMLLALATDIPPRKMILS